MQLCGFWLPPLTGVEILQITPSALILHASVLAHCLLYQCWHKIIDWLWLEGTSRGPVVQLLCSSQTTSDLLPMTISRQLLKVFKKWNSTASLGNLCQCLDTCTVKKCFLMFRWRLLCFSLCPVSPVMAWMKRAWLPSSLHSRFGLFLHIDKITLSLLVSRLNSSSFQPFLTGEML